MRTETGNYFHPRKFIGNNIKYRISTSNWIAKFKESQSVILSQVSFNPYHDFSFISKEIILFSFDIYFDYICEVEQFLLSNRNNEKRKEEIKRMLIERLEYFQKMATENDEIFEEEFFSSWLRYHSFVVEEYFYFIEKIIDEGITNLFLFSKSVEFIIKMMNNNLYVLQEFDSFFFSKDDTHIFILDDLSCLKNNEKSFWEIRFEIFEKKIKYKKAIIKDYISESNNKICLEKMELFLEERGIKSVII